VPLDTHLGKDLPDENAEGPQQKARVKKLPWFASLKASYLEVWKPVIQKEEIKKIHITTNMVQWGGDWVFERGDRHPEEGDLGVTG